MALACSPRIVTECVSCLCREGFGRFFSRPRDDRTEKEGDACGDEGDNRSLDLKEGKVAEDNDIPDGRSVEVTQVRCGTETR